MFKVRRALISVSDKRDLIQFAQGLADLGVEILSTGGTCRLNSGCRHRGSRGFGENRLSGNHGWQSKDPAPGHSRRPAWPTRHR